MAEEKKESNTTVTVLATVGLVIGLIGSLGSCTPCIGPSVVFLCAPGAILAGVSLYIAKKQNVKTTLPIIALIISLIGFFISILLTLTLSSESGRKGFEEGLKRGMGLN